MSRSATTMSPVSRSGDLIFRTLCQVMVCVVLVLVVLVGWTLWQGAGGVFHKFGFKFLTGQRMGPGERQFRRAALYLRDPRVIRAGVVDRDAPGGGDRGLPDGGWRRSGCANR